jgi:hypothetical protein
MNAVRPGKRNREVKYAAGTETRTTMMVEDVATSSEVLSQFRNRWSPRTSPKVDHCQVRGRSVGGVWTTSLLGRSEFSTITM